MKAKLLKKVRAGITIRKYTEYRKIHISSFRSNPMYVDFRDFKWSLREFILKEAKSRYRDDGTPLKLVYRSNTIKFKLK